MGSLANTAYGPPRDAFRDGCTASSCAWWHGAVLSKGSGSLVACSRPSHAISCEQDARHAAPRGGVGEEVALGLPLVACSRWQAARRRRMGYWQSASHAKDEAMVMCYGKRLANACLIGWSFEALSTSARWGNHGQTWLIHVVLRGMVGLRSGGVAWQGMARHGMACVLTASFSDVVRARRPPIHPPPCPPPASATPRHLLTTSISPGAWLAHRWVPTSAPCGARGFPTMPRLQCQVDVISTAGRRPQGRERRAWWAGYG